MSEPRRLGRLLFALVLLLGLAAPLAARPTAPEELVGQAQKKYQQLRSLEFDFAQATRTGVGASITASIYRACSSASPPTPEASPPGRPRRTSLIGCFESRATPL